MGLRELQLDFGGFLRGDAQNTDRLFSRVSPEGGLSVESRLGIYRGNVRGALGRALELSYPATRRLVGERYFSQLAGLYFRKFPSRCRDLNLYGESFPGLLEAVVSEREEARSLVYLPDVARIEWLHYRCFYGEPVEGVDYRQAWSVLPSSVLFRLSAGLSLFAFSLFCNRKSGVFKLSRGTFLLFSPYSAYSIWNANAFGDGTPGPSFEVSKPEMCMVARRGFRAEVRAI